MLAKLCIPLALLFCAATASADSVADAVNGARSKASSYDLKLSSDVLSGTSQADTARKTANYVNSPEYQERVRKESDRIQREVFGISPKGNYYPGVEPLDMAPHLKPDERVYIFVSSSMPEATIRAYTRAMDKLGDNNVIMVMRGFVGGADTFKPTLQFISRILSRDPNCVDVSGCPTFNAAVEIDPNLYRKYRPLYVPAVVYASGIKPHDPDMSEGLAANVSDPKQDWLMLYGDASLDYLLSKAAEAVPDSGSLAGLAEKLTGGNHAD